MISLRWRDRTENQLSIKGISARQEGIICLIVIALSGFITGISFRFGGSLIFMVAVIFFGILALAALYIRQVNVSLILHVVVRVL